MIEVIALIPVLLLGIALGFYLGFRDAKSKPSSLPPIQEPIRARYLAMRYPLNKIKTEAIPVEWSTDLVKVRWERNSEYSATEWIPIANLEPLEISDAPEPTDPTIAFIESELKRIGR